MCSPVPPRVWPMTPCWCILAAMMASMVCGWNEGWDVKLLVGGVESEADTTGDWLPVLPIRELPLPAIHVSWD